MRRGLCLSLLASLALGGCAGSVAEVDLPMVVATTTIVGDLTTRVAGDEAIVEVLMPVGADPCGYEPTTEQTSRLLEADLIVSSGLDLEVGLADALTDAELRGVDVLRLGDELHPRHLGHDAREALDPYWWMDPLRAAGAFTLIADRMLALRDGGWATRALEAERNLCALDTEIRDVLWRGEPGPRYLLTDQPGLGYFAERYDCIVRGTGRPPAEPLGPSSVTKVPAVRDESADEGVSRMPETLPTRRGVSLMGPDGFDGRGAATVAVFVDSLGGPGSGAETYEHMMLANADRIARAGPTVIVERDHPGAQPGRRAEAEDQPSAMQERWHQPWK
jgi:zinc/manganese transport system substrate-binding protein